MNDTTMQHHAIREASSEEVAVKRQQYLEARSVLLQLVDSFKMTLTEDEEPIHGEKRRRIVQLLEELTTQFNSVDSRSYEYFEKQNVGVIEKT